jgi:DNA-binding NarL/FixJ family response regulator
MALWRVLIVEDDPETREFFAASVRRSGQLELLAALGTVADALAWLDRAQAARQAQAQAPVPDVLLTDLGLPDGSGLTVMRETLARFADCEPLVISMFGDEDNVLASIEAGAVGYIHKDSTPDDVAQSIVQMKQGASPISPMIARRVLSKYRSLRSAQPAPVPVPLPVAPVESADKPLLSSREQEVLEYIARGFSYSEIARLQNVSVHTVQTHIKHLYGKLAVHSKNEAVFEATKMGLLSVVS